MDTSQIHYWLYSGTNAQVVNTYYDQSQFGADLLDHYPMFIQENIRKRVSSITLRNSYSDPSNEYTSATHYSYDIQGNVKTLINQNRDLPFVQQCKRVDYSFDLISGKVNEVKYQPTKLDRFFYKYQYDADNRLTRAFSSADKIHWNKDAQYYYFKHGPLARVEIGGEGQQGTDYAYTIQGWLKTINGMADKADSSAPFN